MNPIELLQQHCEFNNKYDCYVLLAVSRKKDTPDITNSKEIVFRKIIKKKEEILRKYLQIKAEIINYKDENGRSFPFYLYISLNARDSYQATHLLINDILHWMYEENKGTDRSNMYKRVDGYFYSSLMKPASRTTAQKYFMIDYDEKEKINDFINEIENEFIDYEIKHKTRNGYHIKLKPFDRRLLDKLKGKYNFEIKTDANFFVEYVKNER